MVRFDAIDEKIMRTLYQKGVPMTIGEISESTTISWITVKKHILKLLKYDFVEEVKTDTRKNPKIVWNFSDFGNLAMGAA